jgi:hypothetical protein
MALLSRLLRLVALAALLALATTAWAQTSKEYQIKAAFLYNFTKFVEWPETSFTDSGSIIVGAYCNDAFDAELAAIVKGRSVNGHGLAVRRLESADDARWVHVAFVCASQAGLLDSVRTSIGDSPVLLVADSGLQAEGAAIRFVLVDDKVRFEIDAHAAERAGIKISAQLQKLAVKPGGR